MRVLLSDGSGLTSRQVAARLEALGHVVGVLSSDPRALTRWTNAVSDWHRMPMFGQEPLRWLDAADHVAAAGAYDVLLPTQEQVTALSWAQARGRWSSGVPTPVPPWTSVRKVQDKISSARTLSALGIPRPRFVVLESGTAAGWDAYPAFVKAPIGTASAGVRRVRNALELAEAFSTLAVTTTSAADGLLVEEAVTGPLVMVQAVFHSGRMTAFHAALRVLEGAGGGASHKQSVAVPEIRTDTARLGRSLDWHGALSADVILGPDRGHQFIDVNPRLVEPGNAWHSGLDLVAALLDVATSCTPVARPDGVAGIRTHQLLLALLGAAERTDRRREVWRQAVDAALHRHLYRRSAEELTPLRGDARASVPLAVALAVTSIRPRLWRLLASSSTSVYAISAQGWAELLRT